MADLVELKLSEEEKRAQHGLRPGEPLPEWADDYPYGLRIDLNTEVLAKLNLSGLQAGTDVVFTARARISSVNSHENNGQLRESAAFTIEAMGFDPKPAARPAKSLYEGE